VVGRPGLSSDPREADRDSVPAAPAYRVQETECQEAAFRVYDARAGIDWFTCHLMSISESCHSLERTSRCGVPQGSARSRPKETRIG
jgi:hypothetical protein